MLNYSKHILLISDALEIRYISLHLLTSSKPFVRRKPVARRGSQGLLKASQSLKPAVHQCKRYRDGERPLRDSIKEGMCVKNRDIKFIIYCEWLKCQIGYRFSMAESFHYTHDSSNIINSIGIYQYVRWYWAVMASDGHFPFSTFYELWQQHPSQIDRATRAREEWGNP